MQKVKNYSDTIRLDAMTDSDIQAGIDADPDAAPDLTASAGIRRVRGPQIAPTKKRVSIRLDESVIDYFKKESEKSERGWQPRLNAHLLESIKKAAK